MRFTTSRIPSPCRRRLGAACAVVLAAACGGRPAHAQPPAPADDGLAHAYLYQVSAEHAGALSQAAPPQETPFIEVTGSASVSVPADRVRASFAVETQAATAGEAAQANAGLMDRVIRALRAAGVAGVEIETFGYVLRPDYAYADEQRARRISGYTAQNNIRVTAGDVNAAGTLLDAAIRAGANRVASLVFDAADTEAARREALAQAVRSARLQAEAMADALGRALGAPLEVRGGADLPYPRRGGDIMFRAEAMAVDTPVEAGDLSVSANVTVRFALGAAVEGR